MLREKVLAVELTAFHDCGPVLGLPVHFAARLQLTHPGGEVQVLRRGVALPFVFAGEGAGAAREGEDADEGAGVRACGVALQGAEVFKGRVSHCLQANWPLVLEMFLVLRERLVAGGERALVAVRLRERVDLGVYSVSETSSATMISWSMSPSASASASDTAS